MTASKERRCHYCLQVRPITEFRRLYRDKDNRSNECRACHNKHEAQRQREKRSKRRKKSFGKFTGRINRALDHRKIAVACCEMFDRFGGPVGFSSELARQYESAPAGSALRVSTLNAIIRIAEYVDTNKPQAENLEQLHFEELECLIERKPELVVAAARRAGWTVRPIDAEPN